MGILAKLLGGGIDSKLERLNRTIESGDYHLAEDELLDLRGATAQKHGAGSAVSVRLDLAEVQLRVKHQQFDRAESPARRAFMAAKGLGDNPLLRQATEAMLECAVRGGRFRETVEMAEQYIALGPADVKQRVDVLIIKGAALNQLGRFNDALKSYEAAVRLVDNLPETPDKHERFVTATSGLGDTYLGLDNRAQAINSWRQSMGATRAQFGDNHPQVAAILVCIGTVQLSGDEIDLACTSFTQALEIFRAAGHSEAVGAAVALQKLALTHLMQGNLPAAERTAKEAMAASSSHGPELRAEAQELLRKIEDAKIVPPGAAAAQNLIKPKPATLDDLPLVDRTMFPARAAAKPVNRPGRTNINWAAMGR